MQYCMFFLRKSFCNHIRLKIFRFDVGKNALPRLITDAPFPRYRARYSGLGYMERLRHIRDCNLGIPHFTNRL